MYLRISEGSFCITLYMYVVKIRIVTFLVTVDGVLE
jgi:hypothetical protein